VLHVVAGVLDLDVRLAEDDEEVARGGRLQIAAHGRASAKLFCFAPC
jgi:hypothetical protein